jgi:hypothetical protein
MTDSFGPKPTEPQAYLTERMQLWVWKYIHFGGSAFFSVIVCFTHLTRTTIFISNAYITDATFSYPRRATSGHTTSSRLRGGDGVWKGLDLNSQADAPKQNSQPQVSSKPRAL